MNRAASRLPTPVLDRDHVPGPIGLPPQQVRFLRTLGNGRAATAELVEAFFEDGTSQVLVEKVFAPGLITRFIYRIAFAAPFAYQSNRDAILASFYRRRVVSRMLRANSNIAIDVAVPAYVRFDQRRKAWVLAAAFVEGRGPIPKSLASQPEGNENEMSELVGKMRTVESQLIEMGLVGSGWQVSPQALVSTANLLITESRRLKVVLTDGTTVESPGKLNHTIIDLESGIPAVLLWKYLKQSWALCSLFPFDDLDAEQLQLKSEETATQLLDRGGSEQADMLRHDVAALISHDRRWKAAEVSPFRRPWTWLSRQRRRNYQIACIDRWTHEGAVDQPTAAKLPSRFWQFAMLWVAGLCFPRSLRYWLQTFIGNGEHRRRVHRFTTDARCRKVFWRRYQSQKIQRWLAQGRCDARCRPTSQLGFLAHRFLGRLAPAAVHRYCVDLRRRHRRNQQFMALLTQSRVQSAWGRKAFATTLNRWQSRHWLTKEQATELRRGFDGPQIAVYSRGLGMHLGIKLLYPFMGPMKVGGVAFALAGGSIWYALVPLMTLPTMRTIVTLISWRANRSQGIPHGRALGVGIFPTLGSAAFMVQMWSASPHVATFLIRDAASRFARKIPIYGGPDSRTEHAVIDLADRSISIASISLVFISQLTRQVTCRGGPRSVAVSPDVDSGSFHWWPYPNVIRDSLALMAIFCGGLWLVAFWSASSQSGVWLTGENGALENTQLLFLVATAAFGVHAFSRTHVSSWRSFAIALIFVAIAGATREVPSIESIPKTSANHVSASSLTIPALWKHLVIALSALAVGTRAAYAWFKYPQDRRLWLSPSYIWPIAPFVGCFVLAEVFERVDWIIAEESIEVFAYAMMMTSSIWVGRNAASLYESTANSISQNLSSSDAESSREKPERLISEATPYPFCKRKAA